MVWQQIVFLVLMVLSQLAYIGSIGKEREPVTNKDAVLNTIVAALMIWLILSIGG